MTGDIVALDGNAAAGWLGQLFAFDVTVAAITCGGCGREGPLAELRLYGRGAGLVLRCRECDAALIRMLETSRWTSFDLSGVARITIQPGTAR